MANLNVTLTLTATNPDNSAHSSSTQTWSDLPVEGYMGIQKGLLALGINLVDARPVFIKSFGTGAAPKV